MAAVTRGTGNNLPKLVSPPGYEVVDVGTVTEDIGSGQPAVLGASGWSKAPAGAASYDGVALRNYVATQEGCDFLIQGEMDNYAVSGGATPGTPVWLSASVAGAFDTTVPVGYAGVNAKQKLTITGTPTGGAITYAILGENAVFQWNSDAAAALAVLEALNAFAPGDVVVTGGALPGAALTFEFTGTYASRGVPDFVLVTNALTGGSSPAGRVETIQEGRPDLLAASRAKFVTPTRIRFNLI